MASASRIPARNRLPRPSPVEEPATRPAMSTSSTPAWTTLRDALIFGQGVQALVRHLSHADTGLRGREGMAGHRRLPPVKALKRLDLPELGRPTSPIRSTPKGYWPGDGSRPSCCPGSAPGPLLTRARPGPGSPVGPVPLLSRPLAVVCTGKGTDKDTFRAQTGLQRPCGLSYLSPWAYSSPWAYPSPWARPSPRA